MCTACGFVRLHKFCWIGDNDNVNVFWLSFLPFMLSAFMLVLIVLLCLSVSVSNVVLCARK
jgi:hypothetical protein